MLLQPSIVTAPRHKRYRYLFNAGLSHMNAIAKHVSCTVMLVSIVASLPTNSAFASNRNVNVEAAKKETDEVQLLTIPYAFYNKNTGVAAAGVVAANGLFQPQVTALLNAFVGSNGTTNLFSYLSDYQLPLTDRVFADVLLMYSDWGETESFQNGNSRYSNERAGSNNSDKDNFIEAEGTDTHYRLKLKYVLPIGDGKNNPIHTYRTRKGLLEVGSGSGGASWNPFDGGRTTLAFEPFYRNQDFEDIDSDAVYQSETSGIKFNLEYDNTDWYKNPSSGSRQSFSVTRDWGQNDASSTWTALQFEWSKFISLAATSNSRQRVLALNFWTSDVPTWNSSSRNGEGVERFHRAPLFEGSTLGGLDRQRGYATNRFSDRSAVNYAIEYRHAPNSNPFGKIPLVNKLHIPWWEWVAFVEVGRVADNWSFNDLHEDMKVSAGLGVRVNVFGLIIRADGAVSEDGGAVQMFFAHTY